MYKNKEEETRKSGGFTNTKEQGTNHNDNQSSYNTINVEIKTNDTNERKTNHEQMTNTYTYTHAEKN